MQILVPFAMTNSYIVTSGFCLQIRCFYRYWMLASSASLGIEDGFFPSCAGHIPERIWTKRTGIGLEDLHRNSVVSIFLEQNLMTIILTV